jgi:hypothetical protein
VIRVDVDVPFDPAVLSVSTLTNAQKLRTAVHGAVAMAWDRNTASNVYPWYQHAEFSFLPRRVGMWLSVQLIHKLS